MASYSHEPLSSVANGLKLVAVASVQPTTSNSSQTPSPSVSDTQLPLQSYIISA